MTNSMQRIIDNLRSDSPSMSIWADLEDIKIEIDRYTYRDWSCLVITKESDWINTQHHSPISIADYLEQNYA